MLAIAAAIAVGGRAWDQFSSSDIQFPDDPKQHFADLGGAGRHDFWRVAIDAFGEKPLLGHGAGTYEFSWEKLRSIELPVHDAHSLYLEAFAELGIVGGLLVLGLVGSLLWCGFAAWRDAAGPQRERYAVLLAAMLAFAVGAAFDWFWEIAGLGALFFLAAGVVVAGALQPDRCRPAPRDRTGQEPWLRARGGRGGSGLDRRHRPGRSAAGRARDRRQPGSRRKGRLRRAPSTMPKTPARSSPGPLRPTCSSACWPSVQGDYGGATVHFTHAIEREDRNWQWYYLRSRVEHAAGDEAAAQADLEQARQLNPQAACLRDPGWNCG